MHPLDHAVSRYASDVLDGKTVAGELVRLACERHFRDLETGADRGLQFDCQAANQIINFAKMLHHTQGPLAGRPLTLQPWQIFRHGSVFGWKQPKEFIDPDTGEVETRIVRRFRDTYHQVGKKNGKTTDTAVPMLFTQVFDGEAAPEGYCAATTRDQAGLLFKGLKRIIKKSPFLPHFMHAYRHSIETPDKDGLIQCLSRDGNSSDGINPSFLARDEMHRWTDRELAETIVESMIARAQPIDWVITTAGQDRKGLCGETRDYAEAVLRGQVQDDAFFAYVAEPPADADPLDPLAWAMGNPNLDVSKPRSEVEKAANKATIIAGQMPNFKRFHLNLWTENAETWITQEIWDRGSRHFEPEELMGRKAWVGLDLSNTTDMTAISVAIPVGDEIFLLVYTFLPDGPKGFISRAQTENRSYIAWRDAKWLEVHKGGAIDEDQIFARLEQIRGWFDLQELAFDRWGMQRLRKRLVRSGFPLTDHGQGYAGMSAPMKEFEKLVWRDQLRHNGNPVLAWSVGNVHRDEDAAEQIKPNKQKSKGRIDPAVASIMAVGRAAAAEEKRKAREVMFV